MVVNQSTGRIPAVIHGFAQSERALAGATCNGKPLRIPRYGTTERVSSTVLIASIRIVVVGIENPAQNDVSGPRHARGTLTRYLHVLSEVTRERPVTATVLGKVVVLRIKRLYQHRMMPGNVWGGCKLVSRSYHVRSSRIRSLEHSRQESRM